MHKLIYFSSGKTLLKQASIVQDAEKAVSDPDSGPHCQIVCVWQEGANALIQQYKDLVSTLSPPGSQLGGHGGHQEGAHEDVPS